MPTTTNPYPWGQCTYYVWSVYPALPPVMGDGGDWLVSARHYGFSISSVPRNGWVAVFPRGHGASAWGHVAVVQNVNSDGSFTVTEMNYRALGVIDTRTVQPGNAIGFILPPGAPASVMQAAPPGLNATTAPAVGQDANAAPTSSDSGGFFSSLLGVIVNASLVLGGFVLIGAGIFLAVWGTPQAAGQLIKQQTDELDQAKSSATADGAAKRAAHRANVKPITVLDTSRTKRQKVTAAVEGVTSQRGITTAAGVERATDGKVRRYADGTPITDEAPF